MSVLQWVAVVFGVWCVASVATALTLGNVLRRRREATDPHGALRALDIGPLDFWVGGFPDIPDTPAALADQVHREDEVEVPSPRRAADDRAEVLPERY